MRLVNESLSNLKAYARKEYYLTSNIPVLVMLVSEAEHKTLKEAYDNSFQTNTEQGAVIMDGSKEEFFPNVACIFELMHSYSSTVRPIITPILKQVFKIPHFGKYKYAIIIREEKLLEWGIQMDIQVDGAQATSRKRKFIIFYRILTQEFLHVVECEKGIQIFERIESTDSEIVQRALKAVKVFRDINIFSE
jgi:hypothetical protein